MNAFKIVSEALLTDEPKVRPISTLDADVIKTAAKNIEDSTAGEKENPTLEKAVGKINKDTGVPAGDEDGSVEKQLKKK